MGGKMRLAILALFLIGVVAFAGYTLYGQFIEALEPVDTSATESVAFLVEPGASTSDVGSDLASEGLVRDGRAFALYARYHGYDGRIQAGWYMLTPAMSPDDILEFLVEGRVADRTFGVAEGLNVPQVLRSLEEQGMGSLEELDAAARSREPVERWIPGDFQGEYPVEGYLLPNTYRISWDAGPVEVVARMVHAFDEYMDERRLEKLAEMGMSVHEFVTLASIVEREAVVEEERPVIAGVFHNRLEIGMMLQACATVHYAIGRPGGELSQSDLETDSPYNTYRVEGLPPGPIASPGEASLEATLYPEDVSYLYFVARGDGTHAFADTFAEHQANINRYR